MEKFLTQDVKILRNLAIPDIYSERNVHDNLKHLDVAELQQITQSQTFPFWVMCLNVLGDLNVATVIRSAHLLGAERCVVFGRRKIDRRGLVGAAHYTPVDKVWAMNDDMSLQPDQFVNYCETHELCPVFVEQGGHNLFEFDWTQAQSTCAEKGGKLMLVLGTEREGIPESILKAGQSLGAHVVSIPQRGVIRSHNLSMAFALVAGHMVQKLNWF